MLLCVPSTFPTLYRVLLRDYTKLPLIFEVNSTLLAQVCDSKILQRKQTTNNAYVLRNVNVGQPRYVGLSALRLIVKKHTVRL